MTFSDFLQLMHSYIGCDVTKQDYVLYITNLIIREPANDAEEKADDADSYNPLSGKSQNLLHKLYKGDNGRKISDSDSRRLLSLFSKEKFVDEFQSVDIDARINLVSALDGYDVSATIDNVDEVCAMLFYKLIEATAAGRNYIVASDLIHVDKYGQPLPEVPLASVYVQDGIIHIADEKTKLPVQLMPEEEFAAHELPYLNALCDAYADALSMIITPNDLDKLPNRYHHDFVSQRKAYFAAESVQRSVREVELVDKTVAREIQQKDGHTLVKYFVLYAENGESAHSGPRPLTAPATIKIIRDSSIVAAAAPTIISMDGKQVATIKKRQ